MPGLPSTSGATQTSALNSVMNEIASLLDVPAGLGASPGPPVLMQNFGPWSQQFQQMEAKWHQRCEDRAAKCEARHFLRLQECESEWYQRCESRNHEIQEKSAEIASLIVESSPELFLLWLTGIQLLLLYEKTERMKSEGKYNLCGAMELIVCHAKLTKKIGGKYWSGIQTGIDELAKTPAFVAALQNEVAARQLALEAVTACIGCIYNTVSKHANGNDFVITLYEDHYTREECAVLATFLKVQNGWGNGFEWEEVKRKRQTRR